ncbi:MAG TPA: trypsin-like peptidase domain-containing protein [Dehalococcoidia bacterium]|nr:trypsin-like peptidase domain-containing protein [Dehalococcoidia bacterium]
MNDAERFPRPDLPPTAWLVTIVVLALIVGAIAGVAGALIVNPGDGDGTTSPVANEKPLTGAAAQDAAAQATARVLPSVVIVVDDLGNAIGTGAGVIVDERGFIITNEHVIHGHGKLTVVLSNGERRPATLVSDDFPYTDVAVLRVNPGGLKAASFGKSEQLAPGETVLAIGSPDFDYQNTVSAGVVSGVERRKKINGIFAEDLIQTDAAINLGNSGGPLINLNGEVVGLVTFRDVGGDDGLVNISFALSSRVLKPIVDSIISRGVYPRPYFGIEHIDIDATVAAQLRTPIDHGALVQRVFTDSPAARAGIRIGDIILRMGKTDLSPTSLFLNALANVGVNDRVPVQISRNGQTMDVTVEVSPR